MAVKRIFNLQDSKARSCLNCGSKIGKGKLKDNTIYTCPSCGQKMFVDISGSRATLTVAQVEDLRRRIEGNREEQTRQQGTEDIQQLLNENRTLKSQLEKARKDAADWEAAAEGLARMVEQLKAQTKDL